MYMEWYILFVALDEHSNMKYLNATRVQWTNYGEV